MFGWWLWFEHATFHLPRQRRSNPSASNAALGLMVPRSKKEPSWRRFKAFPLHFTAPIIFHLPEGLAHCTCQEKQLCSGIWDPLQVPLLYSQVANHPSTPSQGSCCCLAGPLCESHWEGWGRQALLWSVGADECLRGITGASTAGE